MAYKKYTPANNAFATLAFPIDDTDLTCVLQGKYGRMPTANFILKVTHTAAGVVTSRENIYVTTRTGANCTGLIRAYEPVPTDDAATTNIQQALNFDAGDLCEATISAEVILDMQNEIDAKLAKNAGTRTGFGADKHTIINRTSGNEEIKNVSTVSSATNTNLLRMETAAGDYEDITYQNFATAIASSSVPPDYLLPAGEDFSVFPMSCYIEEASVSYLSYSDGGAIVSANPSIGDATARTKKSAVIIGNGTSVSNIFLHLWKTGAPTDNFTVRVETDNAGVPSGSLAHANASGTIAGGTVTTGVVGYTINFTGAFTLTYGVKYHVVFGRVNTVDPSNYFRMHILKITNRFHTSKNYNGTTWSDVAGETLAFNFTGRYTRVICKTIANTLVSTNYDCFNSEVKNTGQLMRAKRAGIITGFSGLVEGVGYFTSNTAGVISTTAGTNSCYIGTAKSATELNALAREDNNFTYPSAQTAEIIGMFGRGGTSGFTYTAKQRETIYVSHTNGAGSLYKNNTVIWTWAYVGTSTRTTTVEMFPGDVLIGNFGVDTYSPSVTVSKIVRTAMLGVNNV